MIVITGASGKTGSKLADLLLDNNKKIRVLGRSADHLHHLEQRGAEVLLGDQADSDFLTKAFSGAEAAYLLIPPNFTENDYRGYYNKLGDAASDAIKKSGLRKLVFLSSLGAELDSKTGPVIGLHDVERKLDALNKVDIVFLRPGYFMENLQINADQIRQQKMFGNTFEPNASVLMVATTDIAHKAAELLSHLAFRGHSIAELFGESISYKQLTTIIGSKLGIPTLPYVQFPAEAAIDAMTKMGLAKGLASSFVELSEAISEGRITTKLLNSKKPNAPTTFAKFLEAELNPVYKNAA